MMQRQRMEARIATMEERWEGEGPEVARLF
jgi:hypothetical protein